MWVQRNTVSANPGARIKRHKAERLGRGRANDFPGVDVQRVTQARHFVSHADVYRAESVLQELGGLSHARRTDRMNVLNDLRVKRGRSLSRIVGYAAHDFRNVMRLELRVSRIDA